MATLEQGLESYLRSYAGLSALISTRIYPLQFPQGVTMPCLTYQRISTPRVTSMDSIGAVGDLAHPRVQFDAWATTYASAKAITDQVRAALNGKTGSIGATPNTVTIRAALVDDERPSYDTATNLYRCQSDYIIWQEE